MILLYTVPLILLKVFRKLVIMERRNIIDGNLADVLTRCTDFEHMRGKFVSRKTDEICPRMVELQKQLGFAPGEPLNSSNVDRLIPAARDIHCILGKPNCNGPRRSVPGNQAEMKARSQPHKNCEIFKGQRINNLQHDTVRRYFPYVKKKQNGPKNSMVYESASNLNTNMEGSISDKYVASSILNKSFNASYFNRNTSYSSKPSNIPSSRKNLNSSDLFKSEALNTEILRNPGRKYLNENICYSNVENPRKVSYSWKE